MQLGNAQREGMEHKELSPEYLQTEDLKCQGTILISWGKNKEGNDQISPAETCSALPGGRTDLVLLSVRVHSL